MSRSLDSPGGPFPFDESSRPSIAHLAARCERETRTLWALWVAEKAAVVPPAGAARCGVRHVQQRTRHDRPVEALRPRALVQADHVAACFAQRPFAIDSFGSVTHGRMLLRSA